MKKLLITLCSALLAWGTLSAQRTEILLEKNWKFYQGDQPKAAAPDFDDSRWQAVTVPHDWAIFGPFDRSQQAMYDDHQCSGYDMEACSWSNVPDEDFALAHGCLAQP